MPWRGWGLSQPSRRQSPPITSSVPTAAAPATIAATRPSEPSGRSLSRQPPRFIPISSSSPPFRPLPFRSYAFASTPTPVALLPRSSPPHNRSQIQKQNWNFPTGRNVSILPSCAPPAFLIESHQDLYSADSERTKCHDP